MAALDPDDPRSIGAYQLLGRLGAGGMGRVFLGRSPGGRQVAVKVVHAALVDQPGFRDRFRREVRAARAVSGAFTAPVIDADPDADEPWLVTSYIAGPSLEKAVAERGPMPPAQVFSLAAGLAEALISIHGAHLVHRDLKPSNVLLAADGPRVIDFGIARLTEGTSFTATGYALGSPGFMSPEQVNGEKIGPASDVFSLGTVLAYAAIGGHPFGNGHVASLLYRVVHDSPDLDAIADPALRALIADCLAKDPARRPTPRELLARCGGAAAGTAVRTTADAPVMADAPSLAASHGAGAPHAFAPPPAPPAPGSPAPAALRIPAATGPGAGPTPVAHPHTSATPPPGASTPGTPAPGTPAPGMSAPGIPAPGMSTPVPQPTGPVVRRRPARRTFLISAATTAAVVAVGVPVALAFTDDTAQGSAPPPTAKGPTPVASWPLDERSGTLARDSAGSHDGAASDIRWGTGSDGGALFNGLSSQISTRDPVLDTAPGHSFTVSAWVFLTSANGFATAVSQGTSGGSAFYLQYAGADRRWAFSRPGVRALATQPPALNTWTHLVGVCDAASGRLLLYVNGTQQATATDTRPTTPPGPLLIGRATLDSRPVDYFTGRIKNVQVYDRALNAEQIAALNRAG
ncbi:protein kinase [Streptomyces sp. NRRL F-4489]|uniref:protein kinase domain-containing protein n=1 Tax=Streptomyces sp. NRRL F-4489 TaxID=1609095 RepID=UPI0007488314|nr:LamG-like jellyroll fold domain-containing protein [Streptomyces sp. NRRL F-4489]KUL35432.1 protein kinase [Streptomyces sp. NRRL F-4489]